MINKINSARPTCTCSGKKIDEEHKRIIQKLYEKYGIRATGNKAVDRALLREKEVQEAEKLDSPRSGFLTLSRIEVEKIIEKKKKKKVEENPELFQNTMQGQKLLAEQMMVYMQMQVKKTD